MTSNITWLTKAYMEPHRKYHDLAHIAQMFYMADHLGVELTEAQLLAIWFHDCVYDPFSRSNERESAAKAVKMLTAENLDPAVIKTVEHIILDTKKHVSTTEESKAVLDLDISILGSTPASYQSYAQLIRDEYRQIPFGTYKVEREQILIRFLKRAKKNELYYLFGEQLNEETIVNLEWEIDVLKAKEEV